MRFLVEHASARHQRASTGSQKRISIDSATSESERGHLLLEYDPAVARDKHQRARVSARARNRGVPGVAWRGAPTYIPDCVS